MPIQYYYTFITYFFSGNKSPHVFTTIASNDLTAMKLYCMNEDVQSMSMSQIDKLVITHVRME